MGPAKSAATLFCRFTARLPALAAGAAAWVTPADKASANSKTVVEVRHAVLRDAFICSTSDFIFLVFA